jgi:hypothetical protein
MKVPSRSAVILFSVLAGLLLTIGIFWQYEQRRHQYLAEKGQFEQRYLSSITDLRLAQDKLNACFRKNGTIFIEVKKPAPVLKKETAAPAADVPALAAQDPILLQGISWGAEKPVAMIDGKVYQEGDRVRDCTLEGIRIRSIVLRDSNGVRTVIKLMEANP